MTTTTTISYIAAPTDRRCRWWEAKINHVEPRHLTERMELKYLKNGADLELNEGEMLITSEEMHAYKNRGYSVRLGVAVEGKLMWITPTAERKQMIKDLGHKDLMQGSGDVAGVVRMALWLKDQKDLSAAVQQLLNCQ